MMSRFRSFGLAVAVGGALCVSPQGISPHGDVLAGVGSSHGVVDGVSSVVVGTATHGDDEWVPFDFSAAWGFVEDSDTGTFLMSDIGESDGCAGMNIGVISDVPALGGPESGFDTDAFDASGVLSEISYFWMPSDLMPAPAQYSGADFGMDDVDILIELTVDRVVLGGRLTTGEWSGVVTGVATVVTVLVVDEGEVDTFATVKNVDITREWLTLDAAQSFVDWIALAGGSGSEIAPGGERTSGGPSQGHLSGRISMVDDGDPIRDPCMEQFRLDNIACINAFHREKRIIENWRDGELERIDNQYKLAIDLVDDLGDWADSWKSSHVELGG